MISTDTPRTTCPRDFDPFRAQIRDCCCAQCRAVHYVAVHPDHERAKARAAVELLDALRAGTHARVERHEHVAQAQAEHAARAAQACASGASEFHLFGLDRGYQGGNNARIWYGEPYSEDMMIGLGIGMTAGRHEAAAAALAERRARHDADRAARVPALIEQDARNRCTWFRVTGDVCDHHRDAWGLPPAAPHNAAVRVGGLDSVHAGRLTRTEPGVPARYYALCGAGGFPAWGPAVAERVDCLRCARYSTAVGMIHAAQDRATTTGADVAPYRSGWATFAPAA